MVRTASARLQKQTAHAKQAQPATQIGPARLSANLVTRRLPPDSPSDTGRNRELGNYLKPGGYCEWCRRLCRLWLHWTQARRVRHPKWLESVTKPIQPR
jgi:hypothetical protein